MIVAFGQVETVKAQAEAIAARFSELNAASSYPVTLYPLSTGIIDQLWGTAEARQSRINYYLRSIAIHTRSLRRSVLEQGRTRDREGYTEGHYAGIVIMLLQRKFPDAEAAALISIGDVAITLIRNFPDTPRGLVCDVVLAMTRYFGIPEAEGEKIPTELEKAREKAERTSTIAIIGVISIFAVFAFLLSRR